MDHAEQIAKYEDEIRRLDVLDKELDVLLEHAPRYALLAVLAPAVWYFFGGGWALVELLVTGALVGTQMYLLKMRKSENRWNRESLVEDVRRIRAEQVWASERPSAG
ncbi:MAG TPA: hypothetical protein VFX59_03990 [Polyangiales bacterium]|nr:hypothetical protein [Polyangiales bacterium]